MEWIFDGPAVERSSPLLMPAIELRVRYFCVVADSMLLRPNRIFDSLNSKILFIDSVSHGNGRGPVCDDLVIGFDFGSFGTR